MTITTIGTLPFADADNDQVVLTHVNGVAIPSFPHRVTALIGELIFSQDGTVQHDDLGTTANNPADGVTVQIWSGTVRGSDGTDSTGDIARTFSLRGKIPVDTTAPILTSQSAAANGQDQFTGAVTTDEVGTLYYVVIASSATVPNQTQIKAGQNGTGGAATGGARSQNMTATGAQTLVGGGLSPSTAYKISMFAEDAAGNQSAVVTTAGFTTANAPGGTLTFNTSVSTLAALTTLVNNLAASWDVTAAQNGGAAGQPFTIGLADGNYGQWNLSNKVFAQKLTIVPSQTEYGAKIAGVSLTACKNMRFQRIYFGGPGVTTGIRVKLSGLWDVMEFVECHVVGTEVAGTVSNNYGMDCTGNLGSITGCGTNLLIKDCVIERAGKKAVLMREVDGGLLEGNCWNESGDDDCHSTHIYNVTFRNNWSTVRNRNPIGAHMDFFQLSDGGSGSTPSPCRNLIIEGNVCADWEFPGPPTQRQSYFLSDINHDNLIVRNNVAITGSIHGITCQCNNATVTNNLTLYMLDANNPNSNSSSINSGAGTFRDNIIRGNTARDPSDVLVAANETAYLQLFGALRTPADTWVTLGVGADASDLYPQTGSIAHWSTPGAKGPYARLREIFIDGVHPGNAQGIVAVKWNQWHNPKGRITS